MKNGFALYRLDSKPVRWSDQAVHRWYFMTEGLPIHLVRTLVGQAKGPILDPFLGAGTVLTEAKFSGKSATGIDINPFMCFVAHAKAQSYQEAEIKSSLASLLSYRFDWKSIDLKKTNIGRLEDYYTPSNLKKLKLLQTRIAKLTDPRVRRLFLVGFAKVAIKASRMRKTPAPRFTDSSHSSFEVLEEFEERMREIIRDLSYSSSYSSQESLHIIRGDSRNLGYLKENYPLIITSPPYCNNVDFVRHSQLELFWLKFASTRKDLGRLRHMAITSCEAMAHDNKDDDVALPKTVLAIADKVEKKSERRYHEVIRQYFAGMSTHLESAYSVLTRDGRGVYVIGDSWFQGVHIPTHEILATIARGIGFHVKVSFLRRRLTGHPHSHPLFEYIIEATK